MIAYRFQNNASGYDCRTWNSLSTSTRVSPIVLMEKVEPKKTTHWQIGKMIIYHEGITWSTVISHFAFLMQLILERIDPS